MFNFEWKENSMKQECNLLAKGKSWYGKLR